MWQSTRNAARGAARERVDFDAHGDGDDDDPWRALQNTLLGNDDDNDDGDETADKRDRHASAAVVTSGDLSFPVLPSSTRKPRSTRATARAQAASTAARKSGNSKSAGEAKQQPPTMAQQPSRVQKTLTRAFSEKEMERLFDRYEDDDSGGGGAVLPDDMDISRFLQQADEDDGDEDVLATGQDTSTTPRADEFLALLTRPATSAPTSATASATTTTKAVVVPATRSSPPHTDASAPVVGLHDTQLVYSSATSQPSSRRPDSAKPALAPTRGSGYLALSTSDNAANTAAVQLAPLSREADATPADGTRVSDVTGTDASACHYVYWLDAKEQPHGMSVDPGSVFVFGKLLVPDGGYESCCVRVRNMSRCVYVLPAAGASEVDVVGEINELCRRHGIEERRVKFVQRYYAFEQRNVPRERTLWAKLRYPARYPPLTLSSSRHALRYIAAVLGASTSLLELLLLKRKLKGPSFLQLDAATTAPQRISHCAHELVVDSPKRVRVVDDAVAARLPPPLLTMASVQLHAQLDSLGVTNEVHMAAVAVYHKVNIEATLPTRPHALYVGVRPFAADVPLPLDLDTACGSSGLGGVRRLAHEQALLEWLMEQLGAIDADLVVGHNFTAFTLATLLTRCQELSVRRWSTLGRLDLKRIPRWHGSGGTVGAVGGGGGGNSGGSGHEREVCAGRLIVDTYTLAREYYKTVNYKLLALAQQMQLTGLLQPPPQQQQQTSSSATMGCVDAGAVSLSRDTYATAHGVVAALAQVCNSAVLACGVAAHLDVVRLTKRLTSIAGNLWARTLCGARSERIEYLLLHAFHGLKFITPDKHSYHTYNNSHSHKRARGDGDGAAAAMADDSDAQHASGRGADDDPRRAYPATTASVGGGGSGGGEEGRRKAKYQGGIVLEPKCGLYTDYVLLLDFNSLYPSLIQEFNICFTTIERGDGDEAGAAVPAPEQLICGACAAAALPSPCLHRCVLPRVIKSLVDSRREVKRLMRDERDTAALALLEIRQKALKLTANSMYGCLGFEHSRFYAQQLAELVTRQGRLVLQSTVELVPQINPTLRVIYGDTDSVMIQTGIKDNIAAVRELGQELKTKINKRYRSLEIDIDGVFRAILLLKKKKYAALTVADWQGGGSRYVREVKGLDMVRRDWCPLSKQVSDEVLHRVLGADGGEDVLDFIMRYMRDVADKVRRGDCYTLDQFVISKSLTKEPEAYHGSAFPHAAVALRMKQRKELVRVGDLIPYVMCVGDKLADKAFHVDEVRHNAALRLDAEWYIAAQLYPPVLRLCEHIQGFTSAQLGDAMGVAGGRHHEHAMSSSPSLGHASGTHHSRHHGTRTGKSSGAADDDDDDDDDDNDNAVGGRRGAGDFDHCAMFASRDPADCFPAALQLQVTCPHCQLATPVDPYARVRSVMARKAAATAAAAATVTRGDDDSDGDAQEEKYDLYVCSSCERSLPVAYVANCLTQVCYQTMRRFYECGGGSAAARAVREQMTFFRALFDVPHAPGCGARVKLHHRARARRCLGTDGRLYTIEEAEDAAVAEECDPVDPVRATAETFYKRVEHMFVNLATLFAPAPSLHEACA